VVGTAVKEALPPLKDALGSEPGVKVKEGTVPADHAVIFEAVTGEYVNEGRVPTAVIELTVVVFGVTVIVGVLTVPAGV
jgi:hypothetical protein